jgi:hypothetical protein
MHQHSVTNLGGYRQFAQRRRFQAMQKKMIGGLLDDYLPFFLGFIHEIFLLTFNVALATLIT